MEFITPVVVVCAVIVFFLAGLKISAIHSQLKKLSVTEASLLKYQKELLKEARIQTRLNAQLLIAYGHEPDYGSAE